MSGQRFRLLTEQENGPLASSHLSSVILNEEEAQQSLNIERMMHQWAGWAVEIHDGKIVCKRNSVTRTITIKSFDAMNDPPTTE